MDLMTINFNNMLDVLKSSGNHNFKMGETLDFLEFKIFDIRCCFSTYFGTPK